jgi:hypothetical protein
MGIKMAILKTVDQLKKELSRPRLEMLEMLRKVNAAKKATYYVVVDGESTKRIQISKDLFGYLETVAKRQDTFSNEHKRNCEYHYKTLTLEI